MLEFGFRPEQPGGARRRADRRGQRRRPDPAQSQLEVPASKVLVGVLDAWAQQRKDAKVLLVLDVSGSMGDSRRHRGHAGGKTHQLSRLFHPSVGEKYSTDNEAKRDLSMACLREVVE